MTSIADFSRDKDWTPPPTNKIALNVTLNARDSVSFAIRHANSHFDSDCNKHSQPHFELDGSCACLCGQCYVPDHMARSREICGRGECVCVECNASSCELHEKGSV